MEKEAVEGGLWRKIKGFFADFDDDIFLVLCVVLIALAAFGLGRFSVIQEEGQGVEILYPEGQEAAAGALLPATGEQNFVASLSGTKYHLPTCSGAKRIKDENKIWFATAEEARIAGYEPAANCPGL